MNNSKFQFNGFLIKEAQIKINQTIEDSQLTIKIKPSGILNKKDSKFTLFLKVTIKSDSKDLDIKVSTESNFTFDGYNDEQLKGLLYLNAPAILFPYVRAYISTLTTLSGVKSVVLPTLNLVSLKSELEENTKIIE